MIFFVFWYWKSIATWLSTFEGYITQLFLEVWLTICDFNFKIEGSLLIQRIRDVAPNFKLSKMSYRFEYVLILWKFTERRQFCVRYSHREQLKIKIRRHCIGWNLIHNDFLRLWGSECKYWRVVDYVQLNGFTILPFILICHSDL